MLPNLTISNHVIESQEYIKFLEVLLDENLNQKEYNEYRENKMAKNLGQLYKTRPFLDRNTLLALYYSCIKTYINYANIAWGSYCKTNLKKANSQQKHGIRFIECSMLDGQHPMKSLSSVRPFVRLFVRLSVRH